MNLKLASFNVENLKIKELSEKDKANQFNLEKEKRLSSTLFHVQ